MSESTPDFSDLNQLRQAAEASLKQGTPPPTHGWSISAEALSLLYRLASTPDSASDALKLLHELQAHQVELDLQHEQLRANEQEFSHQQERYRALFERAPFGYLVVSRDGQIIETNQNAASLLGVESVELAGGYFDSFLSPEGRVVFGEVFRQLGGGGVAHCEVETGNKAGESRRLQVSANIEPNDDIVLLAFLELKR